VGRVGDGELSRRRNKNWEGGEVEGRGEGREEWDQGKGKK